MIQLERFVYTTAMLLCGVGCILAAPVANAAMSSAIASDAIRPFHISIPERALTELRQRVQARNVQILERPYRAACR